MEEKVNELISIINKYENYYSPFGIMEDGEYNEEDGEYNEYEEEQIVGDYEYQEACYSLADCYIHGDGVEKSFDNASYYLHKIIFDDYKDSRIKYAENNYKAKRKNVVESIYWWKELAKSGNENARKALIELAEQGDKDLQFNLATLYVDGACFEKSLERAAYWYNKAIEGKGANRYFAIVHYNFKNFKNGINLYYKTKKKALDWVVDWANDDNNYREFLFVLAEKGDENAKFKIVNIYANRLKYKDLSECDEKAYVLAVQNCNIDAQYEILKHNFYNTNKMVDFNNIELNKLLESANQGDVNAQYELALYYMNGKGAEKSKEKAMAWLFRAARCGNADAQNKLGECYEENIGVKRSITRANHWYTIAAINGNANAQYIRGRWFYFQQNETDIYGNTAQYLLEKAAEQGHADAQYLLADYYMSNHELGGRNVILINDSIEPSKCGRFSMCSSEAYWYKKAAEQGHAEAQYMLASFYEDGYGGIKKSSKEAEYWYKKAAEQGIKKAESCLAELYVKKENSKRTLESDEYWYKIAGERGNLKAQYNMAMNYYMGEGVEKSYEIAFRLLQEPAENGYIDALYRLAECYHYGQGVEKSDEMALGFYRKASKLGHVFAKDMVRELTCKK